MAWSPRARALVGREQELGRVERAVGLGDGVRPGGLVVLSGDAGIGKTRLLAELGHRAAGAGWSVASGHCVGLAGSAMPYLPVAELLATLAARHPDEVEAVRGAHPDLTVLLPRPVAGSEPARAASDPDGPTDPGRVAAAVHACLAAVGSRSPLLAVVEDVHWADHSTRDLLTLLLTRGFPSEVALVVTYRSDDLHRGHPLHATLPVWTRLPGVARVDLPPLPPPAMRALVSALPEAGSLQPATVHDLVDRAEGNAFLAEELVAGGVHGSSPGDDLHRLLRLRVEGLEPDAQLVVRAAAVGGRTVAHDLLALVVALPDERLEAALGATADHHVLEPVETGGRVGPVRTGTRDRAGAAGRTAYTFRHALLAEAVAADLLPGARSRLHAAYLRALLEDPALGSHADLARHALAVGDVTTAVAASVAAGSQAMAIGGPRDALRHFERALGLLEDPAERAPIAMHAANAALAAGDQVRSVDLLRDALEDTPAALPGERAALLADLALRLRILDLPGDPLALTREAMALLPPARDELRVTVLLAHAQTLLDHGDLAAAAETGEEMLSLAAELGLARVVVEARVVLTHVLELRSDLPEVERRLRAVLEELGTTGHESDPLVMRARLRLGGVLLRHGRLEESLEHFEAGYAVARAIGRPWTPFGSECRLYAGVVATHLGRWERAAELLDSGRDAEVPQPGGSLLASALLQVRAGRGEDVPDAEIDALRAWWDVDVLVAAYTLYGAIPVLARRGDDAGLVRLVEDCVRRLERSWSVDFLGIVRIAALVLDAASSAVVRRGLGPGPGPGRGDDPLVALARGLGDRARERLARPEATGGAPGVEALAWGRRLEAERLRLEAVVQDAGAGVAATGGPAPDPAPAPALVAAWGEAEAAFAEFGHVAEQLHARAGRALALARAGRAPDAAALPAPGRTDAARLGALPIGEWVAPLLGEGAAGTEGRAGADRGRLGDPLGDPRGGPLGGPVDPARADERATHRREQRPAAPDGEPGLTPREREVLGLVARGRTNGEIGRALFISTKTASVHVSNILAKLGAANRAQAAALARERDLLDD